MPIKNVPDSQRYLAGDGGGTLADPFVQAVGLVNAASPAWVSALEEASGDNTVVAAPGAGYRLVLHGISLQRDTTTETTACIVKAGASQILPTVIIGNDVPMIIWDFSSAPVVLAENVALVLNLSAAQGIMCGACVATEDI
jgi:hypothetical protein